MPDSLSQAFTAQTSPRKQHLSVIKSLTRCLVHTDALLQYFSSFNWNKTRFPEANDANIDANIDANANRRCPKKKKKTTRPQTLLFVLRGKKKA